MQFTFEWDPGKARTNITKHGVSFELAATVFSDPMALSVFDSDHSSKDEDRWVTLGKTSQHQHLVVIHTYSDSSPSNATIRIISARLASKNEIKQYEG